MNKNEVILINDNYLKDKIYTIRGVPVMLDYDLAYIYGYSTKALNQQVKNNIDKFDEDFWFQLTEEEFREILSISQGITSHNDILRSKILTSISDDSSLEKTTLKITETPLNREGFDFDSSDDDLRFQGQTSHNDILRSQNVTSIQIKSSKGGRTYLPYAFTEQGLYMLMTVLKGELAIKQSKALIRLFKKMKDYIINDNYYITNKLLKHDMDISYLKDNMITRNDLPLMIDLFESNISSEEILLYEGNSFKADIIYQEIFNRAKHSIYIIDNYISIKTLYHLRNTSVDIIIFSDNKSNHLSKEEYEDYINNYPNINISFIKTNNTIHDRFIIIDYNTNQEIIYHLGSSIKDSGYKVTFINRFNNSYLIRPLIDNLLLNKALII